MGHCSDLTRCSSFFMLVRQIVSWRFTHVHIHIDMYVYAGIDRQDR